MELTAAYPTVANEGVFNAPTPVKSVTGPDGSPVIIQRPSPARVLPTDVAITATEMLFGQTYQGGVNAARFKTWTDTAWNPPVAAATGSNFTGLQKHGAPVSSSMWFIGATPHLVGTTLPVNLARPSASLAGLPPPTAGDPAQLQSGGYAAMVWRAAAERRVQGDQWYTDTDTVHRSKPPMIGGPGRRGTAIPGPGR